MRQARQYNEDSNVPRSFAQANPTGNAVAANDDGPLTDWRELGRQVLSEAMRRSMLELERRNGCGPARGICRGHNGGLS